MMSNISLAAINIFLSIVLGAVAFVFCGLNFPEVLDVMQRVASGLKDAITNIGIPVEYNVWMKFLLQDEQFVFMFFVIIVRVLMALVASVFGGLFAND